MAVPGSVFAFADVDVGPLDIGHAEDPRQRTFVGIAGERAGAVEHRRNLALGEGGRHSRDAKRGCKSQDRDISARTVLAVGTARAPLGPPQAIRSMTEEVVFHHNPQSRAQMAHWMLEEVGAPFRIVPVDFEKGEQKAPSFLALNQMGKLPTIVHRWHRRYGDCGDHRLPGGHLSTGGAGAGDHRSVAAPTYRWLFFGAGCFEPALVDPMLKRPPPEQKMSVGWSSYEDVLATLKTALPKRPYLLGDTFSAADVLCRLRR